MKEIAQDIKSGNFRRVYLLYGEERFLVNYWRKALVEAICSDAINLENLEGKQADLERLAAAAEAVPFFADWRVVVIRDSELFAAGRKADSDAVAEYLKDLPNWAVLIFDENSVDKRGKMYKAANAAGLVYEAAAQKEAELVRWLAKVFANRSKRIGGDAAAYLVRRVSADMGLLYTEAQKLCDYQSERDEITTADIDILCPKSIEAGIFDLLNALSRRDVDAALALYRDMLAQKEAPLMILSMIARQFRFMMQCGHLSQTISQKDIASRLGLNPYAVREFINCSRNFSSEAAAIALKKCLDIDYGVKSGVVEGEAGVELLIAEIVMTM